MARKTKTNTKSNDAERDNTDIKAQEEALAILEKSLGFDHPEVAISLNNLALFYNSQGRFTEAEPLFKRTIVILEKSFGSDHPFVAGRLNNLAGIYRDQRKYTEAESLYERALAILEKILGSDHPNTEVVRYNLKTLQEKNSTKAKSDKRTGYLRSSDNKVDFGMIFLKDSAAKIGKSG